MQYEGVKGSVTEQGHKEWIELDSCQMGVNRHITNPVGKGTNREAAAPSVGEIVITKAQDDASEGLFRAALCGPGKKVTIHFCKTDEDKIETYLQFELENTLVSSYSVSGTGGTTHGRPTESLSLNFTKLMNTYTHVDPKNKQSTNKRAGFDLATARAT
jgi:type VI secretion system secreted protein Hcp